MHKLLYTAAIPLLISNVMAGEFVNSLSVIDEDADSKASSRAATPVEEKDADVNTEQSSIFSFSPDDVASSSVVGTAVDLSSGDPLNNISTALALLAIADSTQFTMPNLATNSTEEGAARVCGAFAMTTAIADMMQPESVIISGLATIPCQIAPDSHVGGSTRLERVYDDIMVADNGSLTVKLILAAGDYGFGEYTYILASKYFGPHPAINADGRFLASIELVPTEEGLAQLLLKLTITEPFTITEAEEDDFGDYQEPTAQVSVAGTNNIVQESDAL